MLQKWLTCLLLLCPCCATYAQQSRGEAALLRLTQHSDSLVTKIAPEKLYIQFDKPAYASGDTIWLKAYLFNAAAQLLSSRSGLLHIDIANDSSKIVKQYLLPVVKGLSRGNIALDEKLFKPGDYTIRAYTNWMRNFGEGTFYYKSIRIAGADERGWLINSKIDTVPGKLSTVRAQLRLTGMDKTSMADSTLQAAVTNGGKLLYRQNIQADKNGLVDVSFTLPKKIDNPAIILRNKNKTKRAVIPLRLAKPSNIDLQFMPEGGSLVAGFPGRIGFKAIDEDGRGVDVSGVVTDRNDSTVAIFSSLHKGIGSFYLNVLPGESYTARITLQGRIVKTYQLPSVKSSGTILQVKNLYGTDSLEVSIAATDDMSLAGSDYYIVAKARGIICYAAVVNFKKGQFIRSKIAKRFFPSGIIHFILMTTQGRPLNERLVYIDHHDDLHINIEPAQAIYAPKDSIALRLNVTDDAGRPVAGNFSLAVTDDAQVKTDSLNDQNILTRMLLASDLKGYIEEPGYYLEDNNTTALDNLLLTQGWVSYEPVDNKISYKAETEFTVEGVVNNVFRSPVKKTHIVLFSRSPAILFDTVTNNEGRFIFNRFPRVDTPVFVLKAVNRAGRSFNVNIDVDEYKMPLFVAPKTPPLVPWYVNTDTILMHQVTNSSQMKQAAIPGGGRLLKEVQIKAKKTIKGSYNLNGPGNADVVIDEKELEEAGKKTFLDMFQERIKGFKVGYFRTPDWLSPPEYSEVYKFESRIRNASESEWYFIHDKPIILIVDGVDIEDVYPPPFNFAAFMGYMRSHSAEDIKGIEVNFSSRYNSHYLRSGKWMEEPLAEPKVRDFAFVEITTRGGGGALISYTPGLYLYKPLAISWPKQFYKPKYAIKDTANLTDLRSTIDWEPNITTDTAGKATVLFYAASTPSTYTIIAEGVDLNGNVGYKRRKISIVIPKETTKSK